MLHNMFLLYKSLWWSKFGNWWFTSIFVIQNVWSINSTSRRREWPSNAALQFCWTLSSKKIPKLFHTYNKNEISGASYTFDWSVFLKSILGSCAAFLICWNGIEKYHAKSTKSYLSRKHPTFQVVISSQLCSNRIDKYKLYCITILFSTMITRKIKDIDTLIDSLPSEDSTKRLQDAALESMNAGLTPFETFFSLFWINTWQGLSELYFREWKARRWITAFCKWSGSITFTNIGHISRHSRYPAGCKTGKFYSLVLALSNISISSESESPSIIRPFWLSSKSYLNKNVDECTHWVYNNLVIFRIISGYHK